MCINNNISSNDHCEDSTNIYGIAGDLYRCYCTYTSGNVTKWIHRNLEPNNSEQYGNRHLYIYPNSGPVCDYGYPGSNDKPCNDNTNICGITGDLYRINGTNFVDNIDQCDHGSVESCNSK